MSEKEKRSTQEYLNDILECIDNILVYISGYTYDTFIEDQKTIDAVLHNIEVIGEASHRIPDKIKEKYKEIPWQNIYAVRNRITHGYHDIDEKIVWNIATLQLQDLRKHVLNILSNEF